MYHYFKKGTKVKPGNYKPVSLASVMGKLWERILKDRIYYHLDRHGLTRNGKHDVCMEIAQRIDNGMAVGI